MWNLSKTKRKNNKDLIIINPLKIVTIEMIIDMMKEEIDNIIEIKIFKKNFQNNKSIKTMVNLKILNFLTNMINLKEVIMSIIFLIIDLKLNLINFFQRLILSLTRNNILELNSSETK